MLVNIHKHYCKFFFTGQLVRRIDMRSGQEYSLDISSWAPGVYTVELPGEHGRRIEKLIVQ